MKKILLLFLALLLLGGGFFLYQRHRVSRELTLFSGGKTYYAYGLTLMIPPGAWSIKGMIRPYLEVRGVTLRFQFEDKEWKTELGTGKISVAYWQPGNLELKIPRVAWEKEDLQLTDLTFLLSGEQITQIGAASFRASDSGKAAVRIEKPRLELGPWEGFLPDRLAFSWEKLESGPGAAKSGYFRIGKLSKGLISNPAGGRRNWEIFLEWQGGEGGDEGDQLTLKPGHVAFRGSVNDLPLEDLKKVYREAASEIGKLETQPSDRAIQDFLSVYLKVLPLVERLDFRPEASKLDWEGLDFSGKGPAGNWRLGSSQGKGEFRYADKGFSGNSMFLLGELTGKFPKGGVDVKNLRGFYNWEFKVAYADFLKAWFGYYGQLLLIASQGAAGAAMQSMMGAFSLYPDQALYELKADQVSYRIPETEGAYRNLTLGMKANNLGWTLYGKGDLDQIFSKDPQKNIQQGFADLSLGLRLPWEKALALVRKQTQEKPAPVEWAREVAGDLGGLESHWNWDLGENWFAGKLDLRLLMDLSVLLNLIEKLPPKVNAIGRDLSDPRFAPQLLNAFLKEGNFDFSLLISRYSKLQAALQREGSSAVMGLAAIVPFVVMDANADSLSVHLELKDGRVMLNGKRNEWIEGWIEKLKEGSI